ncbi:RDD family protein [Flavisolibacter ginsenosidimutans]|uniref:RDD family protein n=1 Tax=Flavisolibacter ginsenosidimutans TaxID=661481 RepID=A0A5B8UGI4_9BACT|nr:RDD family protein [Flavisolibacter ginsenosidimutans]QEC55210.1 RDD family protein [Flavisolibacter ginsenosidimutans]
MSVVRVATNFNIDIEFTAPPFHRRLAAWVIDIVVLIFYVIVASKFLSWFSDQLGYSEKNDVMRWAVTMLATLPFLLYHVVMEATMNGQSVGKKIMGIKVISENGGRPSLGQFIIRWLIRTSDYMLLIIIIVMVILSSSGMALETETYMALSGAVALLLIDLILVNTRKQQRLGDILAHTVLINTKQRERLTDTVFLEVADTYVPRYPQIMRLSDRDINSLKGIIDMARKHRDHNMAFMAAEKIKGHLQIETTLEPIEFLEILLKDYNYLSTN